MIVVVLVHVKARAKDYESQKNRDGNQEKQELVFRDDRFALDCATQDAGHPHGNLDCLCFRIWKGCRLAYRVSAWRSVISNVS
jgi:hypothetical protein